MGEFSYSLAAGKKLKQLIKENYSSQEEFADDYGADSRTISRYANQGINRIDVSQELADFFGVDFTFCFDGKQ